jgi:uncharacterized membrane protein
MKTILGILLMIFGVVLGVYLGVYVMFVGGIVDLIDAIKDLVNNNDVSSWAVAIGIVKIMGASFVGVVSFYIAFIAGLGIIASK